MLEEPPLIVRTQDSIIPTAIPRFVDFRKDVSPILSAPKRFGGENHLSQQPVPGTRTNSGHGAGRSVVPYLALHPMGFSVPPRLRLERWALTPPFHPYPACNFKLKSQARRFLFCGTVRRDASRHRLPRVSRSPPSFVSSHRLRGIAPFGVRTFLPPEINRGSDSPPFQNRR